jgi:hypothetical protein
MQIARHERRERLLRGIALREEEASNHTSRILPDANIPQTAPESKLRRSALRFEDSDPLPQTSPTAHHHISEQARHHDNVLTWLSENQHDHAVEVSLQLTSIFKLTCTVHKNFLPRLKDHLLGRLLGYPFTGDETEFSDEDRNSVSLVNNKIFRHKVMRVNYTTYDMRRSQDSINARTHPDVMVLSREEGAGQDRHPFWYARVIGIYHAHVKHVGPRSNSSDSQKMEFLWVRWFGLDLKFCAGWNAKRLHRIGFMDSRDDGAFGFLDPSEVIRGVHLVPAFGYGQASDLLPPSIARQVHENDKDWYYYYVNM